MNGYGKSAVMKSLYETFGATPHKVDDSWRSGQIASLVEFSLGDREFVAVRAYGLYGIFDRDRNLLLKTRSQTKVLGPALANLLNFGLLMTDRSEETIVPPPSYIFAPFYIDQDHGWVKPWTSFKDLYLPRSSPTLAEYHIGIKSNAFYRAQAERDRLLLELREIENARRGLDQAISEITSPDDIDIQFDLGDFTTERDRLVEVASNLLNQQDQNRAAVARASEEHRLWHEQHRLIRMAISELDADVVAAGFAPDDVECPTCGAHYDNSLIERFHLVEDKDALVGALIVSQENLEKSAEALSLARRSLEKIETAFGRVREILQIERDGLTFDEILKAEGRNEAARLLRDRIAVLDQSVGNLQRQIEKQEEMMAEAADPKRARSIRAEFNERMLYYSATLDVQLGDRKRTPLHSAGRARGSEGTREILAYQFAFLQLARKYGSSSFCPIVIDAPNQQGQDELHLPQILNFMIDNLPEGAQLICAVEDASPLENRGLAIESVGFEKRQVLREDFYVEVSSYARPFLDALVFEEAADFGDSALN